MPTGSQPDSMGKTTIQLDDGTADRLYERKARGESYDDIVRQLLGETCEERATTDVPSIDWARVRDDCGFDVGELEAAQAVVDYCAQHRGATKARILTDVYPDHATGKTEDWWWRQIVTEDGLESAGVLDGANARVMEIAGE